MRKCFLTFDEQINLLKNRNLSFKCNNKDLTDRVKWYLTKYNYHNFINGYNDPFMVNFDRTKNWYRSEVNAQYVIDLFNFDRSLSRILIGDILSVERNFSTQICYHLLKKYKDIYPEINEGMILELSSENFLKIFANINDIKFSKKIHDDNNLVDKEKMLRKTILSFSKGKEAVKKHQDDNYPLWTLSIYWSFGDACRIYKALNDELKLEIATAYFDDNIKLYDGYLESFISIMQLLNNLRNLICHGNVIYKFKNYINLDHINNFFKNVLNINYKKLKFVSLNDAIVLLDYFNPHKKSSNTIKYFIDNVNKLCEKLDSKSYLYLKKLMNINSI